MNAVDTPRVSGLLDAAVEALQTAHRAQRYDLDPCHEDFYAWGWGLADLTVELASVAVLLERQIGAYPDWWRLRDDAGVDPVTRITRCCQHLAEVAAALATASSTARTYHNEMGHVAVDDDRWEVQ